MGTWMVIRWVILAHGINHEIIKLSNLALYHGVIKAIKLFLLATKKFKHIICTLATLIQDTKEKFIKQIFF
jgi:hypothetical protein